MQWRWPATGYTSCSASQARVNRVSGRGMIDVSGDTRSSWLLCGSTFAGEGCRAGCGRSGAGRCVGTHNVLRLEGGSSASPRGSLQKGHATLIKQLVCFGDH